MPAPNLDDSQYGERTFRLGDDDFRWVTNPAIIADEILSRAGYYDNVSEFTRYAAQPCSSSELARIPRQPGQFDWL